MNAKVLLNGLFVCAFLILGSCVSPGDFDQTMLVRYEEAMTKRAPQPREATHGLGFLQPIPGATAPKLKVAKDASGKATIQLSLDEAIMRALANSLDIQVVSFEPEISRDQAIEAAAQFDYILFGSVAWNKEHTKGFGVPSLLVSNQAADSETSQYSAGIKQTTITGAQVSIAPILTRIVDNTHTFSNQYQTDLQLQVTQPLLRNGWSEFNLAKLHIAQLTYKNSLSQFRQKIEETINSVIDNYWSLMQKRRIVVIEEELLAKTIETQNRIQQRLKIDATMVDLTQAQAAVATRRAFVIRAYKDVGDAQDQLSRQLADAQINVLSPYEIIPSTPAQEVPLKVDAADQLVEMLLNNPILEQARIAIAANDIQVMVAKNQTLPRLDFQATVDALGTSIHNFGNSNRDMLNTDLMNYNLALVFEYPIGNRAALATLEQQKYTRLQSIVTLQNTADQLAVQVNERIRQVNTSFAELGAQREAVKASEVQLQALDDIEQIRGRLTPEFVQLKLQAQSTLADAKIGEVTALTNYNAALADLTRITGTILTQHGIDVLKMPAAAGEAPWPGEQGSGGKQPLTTTTTHR